MNSIVKVSLIVPVYNVAQYLRQCLDSIISQSYKNLEIILIDDGSIDGSEFICDEYCKIDTRVKVIHQCNQGISGARNTGIDNASGDYLIFVDSDDYVDSDFIGTLLKCVQDSNCMIAECHLKKFKDGTIPEDEKIYKRSEILSAYEWLTETGLGDFISYVLWNKIYKKELFDGIRFPVGRVYEDEATLYKLVYRSGSIYRTYQKLYNYRARENSITTSQMSPKALNDKILALKERISFFDQCNENRIADFACAKHCINLLALHSKYEQMLFDVYATRKQIIHEISEFIPRILFSRIIPFKYKVYILFKFFCLNIK